MEAILKMKKKLLALLTMFTIGFGAYTATAEAAPYTVQQGETLWLIAQQHSTTVEDLKKLNGMTLPIVHPNQVIQVPDPVKPEPPKPAEPEYSKTMRVTATAYTAYCYGCSGKTATGIDLRANPSLKVIAVDPRVIKLGSKVWVEGYGTAIAGDTGGAIKGNKIDIFVPSKQQAYQWGRRTVTIKVLK